jgi:integrase
MPTVKITESTVTRVKAPDPSGRQVLHWDSEIRGFGILCSGSTTSKSWIVQRAIGSGKQRRLTIGDAKTLPLKEARERAADALDQLRRGKDPKQKKTAEITPRKALAMYLEWKKDLRPASVTAYRYGIEKYLESWLDIPLRLITPEMVESRHREIAAEVESKHRAAAKKHVGPGGAHASFSFSGKSTANGAMRAFGILFSFIAKRVPDMPPNPVRLLSDGGWFKIKGRTGFVRAEDMPAFYKAVLALPNPIARDFILLILWTGMRRGEASSLAWGDVDLHARVIRVSAEKTKSGRPLDLPMSDLVFDLLKARADLGKDKFVFPSNGTSGHIEDPHYPLSMVKEICGIKASAHDLRRTYTTICASSDISPLALKALISHSLGSDITSGYIQFGVEDLRAPAQRVADRLKELCGIAPPMLRLIRSSASAA